MGLDMSTSMKQIQITIPNEPKDRLTSVLEILQQDLEIKDMVWLKGENNSLIIFRIVTTSLEEELTALKKIGIGVGYGIIDVLNLSVTIPESSIIKKDNEDEISKRISTEEIRQRMTFEPDLHYYIFIILAAITAALGLLINSVAMVIAAMIISPLMGPILSSSFGIMVMDKKLLKNGTIGQFFGILIGILIGLFFGIIYYHTNNDPSPTPEMLARNFPSWIEIILAVAAGLAVGFCITNALESSLVGIAIAASLMPPAVNVGLAIAFGEFSLGLGSLTLLLMNIVAINVCALAVFKIKKVQKVIQPLIPWEPIEEKTSKPKRQIGRKTKRGK
jgi:uncharacterized hydrophobic protein (TIGR00271 family)